MYKEEPAVYKITNIATDDFYIGATKNLLTRIISHKSDMSNNCHFNAAIREHCKIYDLSNFKFELLEYCKKEELRSLEKFYINKLNPTYNKIFNKNIIKPVQVNFIIPNELYKLIKLSALKQDILVKVWLQRAIIEILAHEEELDKKYK